MSLIEKLKKNKQLLLMFDYDGTLTPIVSNHERAFLDESVLKQLESLADSPFFKIALISGRNIKTLKLLSGIKNEKIDLFGLHGGEILENNTIKYLVDSQFRYEISKFQEKVNFLRSINGIALENKIYSLALHFRNAEESDALFAINEFKISAENSQILDKFRFQIGKKVIELLPISFSKSNSVQLLTSKYPDHYPIYFGDDKTDISAFKEVRSHFGMSIVVGDILDYSADLRISQQSILPLLISLSKH